jgi:PAS domain S-box-containing protein
VSVSTETRLPFVPAPHPQDEAKRLRALYELSILDTPAEETFDEIAALASFICGTPIAFIGLMDRERLWLKARRGIDATEEAREETFCGYTILQTDALVIPDAEADPRFMENPFVTGDAHIRFYAGVPLRTASGQNVGTLCVLDRQPRELTPEQCDTLAILAKQAATLMEMRRLISEMERVAAAERRTAVRLAAIHDAATEIAILAFSTDGIVTSYNRGAEQMLGYPAASVVDRESVLRFFDAREIEQRAGALSDVFGRTFHGLDALFEYARQGAYDHREWTLRHRDGHTLIVDLVVTAMHDEHGAVSGFVGVAKDVTDQKRSEEARRESEEWFEKLSEASPVGIFRTDLEGQCEYTNSRWQEMAGLTLAECLGTGWQNAIHPEDRERVLATRSESFRLGTDNDMEFRFLRPTGAITLVRSRSRPVLDAERRVTGFVGVVEDITATRQAEDKVRESEQRVRAILDNMLGGLITIDPRSIITSVNPAAERIFGYTAAELVGRSLATLVPDSVGDKESYLRSSRGKSLGRVTEWEGQRKNGEVFPFELSMFTFPTARGVELAGNIRDASETRAAEQAKKDFISTVSHELRTPLTSIGGSLRLLSAGVMGELDPEVRRMVDVAERNSARLLAMINDLLDFERLESGRMAMQVANAPLEAIFRKSVESVAAFAQQEGVAIRTEASVEIVRGDEYRLTQVLVNLLSNAIKFSPAGATVGVSAAAEGEMVEVRVTDQGRGVPAAHRQMIFERFRQVDASDSKSKGGAGLGLAISKAIIDQHGGTIGVESEEGRGSTFWFRVPRVTSPS